ncbi:hypothetical protein [Nocardia wallacei]|uniref:hypothetical protein n=1 Tax=Nocardia wallacei TaxID=480035 RepID=UPI0024552811|nr:hypothetical protein [Nocardia wallacei]
MKPNHLGDLLAVPKRAGRIRDLCGTAPTAIVDREHAQRLLRWHEGHGGTGVCEPYLAACAYVLADDSWCYE